MGAVLARGLNHEKKHEWELWRRKMLPTVGRQGGRVVEDSIVLVHKKDMEIAHIYLQRVGVPIDTVNHAYKGAQYRLDVGVSNIVYVGLTGAIESKQAAGWGWEGGGGGGRGTGTRSA
eukprot:jgi/Psemu1/1986/gm1.1986_g